MFYHDGKVYKIHALIAAAGSASRMGAAAGDVNKVYADLNGTAVILHSINKFASAGFVDSVTAVIAQDGEAAFDKAVKNAPPVTVNKTTGGPSRNASIYNGLKKIMEGAAEEENSVVIIHDGARPNFRVSDLTAALKMFLSDVQGSRPAGVVFASPSFDTLCLADFDGMIEGYADRAKIYKIATPQIFDLDTIYGCFTKLEKINMSAALIFSDESSLAVHFGCRVRIYKCPSDNIKITTIEDLNYLKSIMKAESGVL